MENRRVVEYLFHEAEGKTGAQRKAGEVGGVTENKAQCSLCLKVSQKLSSCANSNRRKLSDQNKPYMQDWCHNSYHTG